MRKKTPQKAADSVDGFNSIIKLHNKSGNYKKHGEKETYEFFGAGDRSGGSWQTSDERTNFRPYIVHQEHPELITSSR